jgi:L-threonylcarbamoyladenylate synthase
MLYFCCLSHIGISGCGKLAKFSRMEFQNDVERCLEALQTGGLILYPTDTIWGIGCDATRRDAVKKVFDLKRRAETKGLIVLMADERDVLKYTSQTDLRVFDFLHTTQKPTTVIYEGPIGLADNLIPPEHTIAIRVIKEAFCKHLIKRFRKPIVSTSANISGHPAPTSFAEVGEEIRQKVDYIVQYRQDDLSPGRPSSVVKWNKDGTFAILRP